MKTRSQSLVLVLLASAFCCLVLSGCQTTKGFGKDVEHVGEKIQGH